jgi:hypothetical protein
MTRKSEIEAPYIWRESPAHIEESRDALNRPQFKIITWHGEDDSNPIGGGGWWHTASVIADPYEGITLYEEVTDPPGYEETQHISLKAIKRALSNSDYIDALGEESALRLILKLAGKKFSLGLRRK